MRWPLLTIASGLLAMYLGGWFVSRIAAKWPRTHPDTPLSDKEERWLAFLGENPWTWMVPVVVFGSIGLVVGGLLWLSVAVLS